MPISEVEEVFIKFRKQEDILDSKINKGNDYHLKPDEKSYILQNKLGSQSLGQAKERNKQILKDLETVKGNLRSKAIYSPSEIQWKEIQENYKSSPSLVVNKWKCHLPVLV